MVLATGEVAGAGGLHSTGERLFASVGGMNPDDLDQPWKVENLRRSVAMLPPGAPALSREDVLLILEVLAEQLQDGPRS